MFTFLRRWRPATFATLHWEVVFLAPWYLLSHVLQICCALAEVVFRQCWCWRPQMVYPFHLEAMRLNNTFAFLRFETVEYSSKG